jgi:hypothetical protein
MADAISAVERRNGGARILAVCWNSVSEPRLEKSGRFADSVILLRWPSSIANAIRISLLRLQERDSDYKQH